MAKTIEFGKRPGDDASAFEINAWRATVDAALNRMFDEHDKADRRFIEEHGGDVSGLDVSFTDPDTVLVHDEPVLVNPIAERFHAYQSALHNARVEGLPDTDATEIAERAADDAMAERKALDPEAEAWLASFSLNTEGFSPPQDLLHDHPFVTAA